MLQFIREKYVPEDESSEPELIAAQLQVWEAALRRFPAVCDVDELEEHQLRAKAMVVKNVEVLDMDGWAKWQTRFPNLSELWIVVPGFLDAKEPLRSAVLYNLRRGVRYVYFVREADIEKGGKFWLLQQQLASIQPDITADVVQRQMIAVPLGEEELRLKLFSIITGFFCVSLIVSNIASAGKMIAIGPFPLSGGAVLFPVTYIFGDILTEVYGYARSRKIIWTGFCCQALAALTFWIVGVYEIAMTPVTMRISEWVKRVEGVDHIDYPERTNYNPFAFSSARD